MSEILRDREFDSLVREGCENAQTDEQVENPLANAVNIGPTSNAQSAERDGGPWDITSKRTVLDAVREAAEPFLRAYYSGRGAFDTEAFLADYERRTGSLEPFEANLLSQIAGFWVGVTLAQEVNEAIDTAKAAGASEDELAEISKRGFFNALTGAGI